MRKMNGWEIHLARQKREWYPGAVYHVMSRGNRRLALFKDDEDYLDFLFCIQKTRERYPFQIHSLCLMTNHFHLLIKTDGTELWKIMQRMLHPYARIFNGKYHFSGHLFEGRYVSCLIEDDRYFLEVSRYIHLNPVKARMVREPLDYQYSSYGIFVNHRNPIGQSQEVQQTPARQISEMMSDLVTTDMVLGAFRNNSREQYRMFVEGRISHAEQELLIQKDMKEDDLWLPW